MPFGTNTARLIVSAAAVLGLSACADLAKPGHELWPYGFGAAEGPADPARLVTDGVLDEEGVAVLFTRADQGQETAFIANRSTDRAITVAYEIGGGPAQEVTLQPGAELPVGQPPGRIVTVR